MFMAKLIQIVGEDLAIVMYQGNVYQLTGDTIISIKMVTTITELLLLCTKQLEYSGKKLFSYTSWHYVYSYYYPPNYIVYILY